MCGIVGAVARRDVVPVLLEGLRRLEYRGYDSAGVAVINGRLQRLRSTGRVQRLAELADSEGLHGHIGIAHTRWATHGKPSETNAHPHVSGGISVAHNGIIENHEQMREELRASGYVFLSETDTEVIAHLIHRTLAGGSDLYGAVQESVRRLEGAYAIAVVSADDSSRLVVARRGAPLLLGLGDGENFAASDTSALLQVTRKMVHLVDGDVAEVTHDTVRIKDAEGREVQRPLHISELTSEAIALGAFRHYMQKEIFEQPAAIAKTVACAVDAGEIRPSIFGSEAAATFARIDSALILACGTSYHAGLVGKQWLESVAGLPTTVEVASEYRYRESVPNRSALVIVISQSGETADTLAALRHAQSLGHKHCLAICNVPESALMHAAPLRFLTRAGPEIGVASTKAFTAQLAALLLLSGAVAKCRQKLDEEAEAKLVASLERLPAALDAALRTEPQMIEWAQQLAQRDHALFLGRGCHFPIACEGALKLKEISYIHAEAYAAGELKHGPLALVDEKMPVVCIAPRDALIEKLKSNLQEVRARGGVLYVLADQDAHVSPAEGLHVVELPPHMGILSPIIHTLPLQLLAYHAAIARGSDVDKPRNLAKSVTVE